MITLVGYARSQAITHQTIFQSEEAKMSPTHVILATSIRFTFISPLS